MKKMVSLAAVGAMVVTLGIGPAFAQQTKDKAEGIGNAAKPAQMAQTSTPAPEKEKAAQPLPSPTVKPDSVTPPAVPPAGKPGAKQDAAKPADPKSGDVKTVVPPEKMDATAPKKADEDKKSEMAPAVPKKSEAATDKKLDSEAVKKQDAAAKDPAGKPAPSADDKGKSEKADNGKDKPGSADKKESAAPTTRQ